MPKISIIVPVYKAEKYLHRCLNSIVAQTFTDWECILVDDGSPDNSGMICDEYSGKDRRFRVFHQENKGISATRENALYKASGEYIQFVDSDDWIEPNMLEIMLQTSIKNNADIVGCNFVEEFLTKQNKVDVFYTSKDVFLNDVLLNRWGVLWKLLIARKLIIDNDIHFPENVNGGEDYVFVVSCLLLCNKAVCVDNYFYHYNRFNNDSFIHTASFQNLMYQYNATLIVEKILQQKSGYDNNEPYIIPRKISVKYSLLKCNFFKSYYLWASIDKEAIAKSVSKKMKLLFLFSYFLNKIQRNK